MRALRSLDPIEQRVVGCLVEKELSTPDVYPLTLNALVAACNQTSNREPVSRLSPGDVEAALLRLMADLLVWRDRGARALRWKHSLDEKLALREPAAKSVLAELLVRGAQTPGELRSRTPRMHEFAELREVEETLRALAARGLVEELPRQPGQKERRWRHLLGEGVAAPRPASEAGEPGADRADAPAPAPLRASAAVATPPTPRPAPPSPPPSAIETELRARVVALERRVAELAEVVEDLCRRMR